MNIVINQPFVIERIFNVPVEKLWDAITKNEQMSKWYFQLADFKPVVGFEFRFTGKADENTEYLHICKITEVIDKKKLTYSWRYDGLPGISFVSFELFPQGDKTRLKLTHIGIERFASAGTHFEKQSFEKGWNYILDKSLKPFLEEVKLNS
jgi:uncharacterized protein YndB with AHSA1/START domain